MLVIFNCITKMSEAIKAVDADAQWVLRGEEPTDAISFNGKRSIDQ